MRVNSSGQLRVQASGGGTNGVSAVNTGQWVHVAAVLPAGASNTQDIQLFVNGIRETTTAVGAAINTLALSTVRIGSNETKYFKGLLDEVRIYDRALTADEIASMMLEHGRRGRTSPPGVPARPRAVRRGPTTAGSCRNWGRW